VIQVVASGTLALTLAAGSASAGAASRPSSAAEAVTVELRGRVVCVGEDAAVRACEGSGLHFALSISGGGLRAFRPGDALAAMFVDDRVRERELLVRARSTASGELETIKVFSVRNGRLHDLDYFCEVCNIVAYAPGPCVCCGRPMALRERPLP
jgi:hypothetical protein